MLSSFKNIRYLLLFVLVLFTLVVGWTAGCFEPNAQQEFRDRLRLPQYIPEYLEHFRVSEESFAGANDFVEPGAQWRWEGRDRANLDSGSHARPGVMMVQVGSEFDLDMGGERVPVEVDGAPGWFTRLSSEDFHPPTDGSPIFTAMRNLPESARGESGYVGVLSEREIHAPTEQPPRPAEFFDSLLWGPAIALQWNRDGVHHLLIAQDIEPMNEDELFRIANSMAPSDSLTPSS